MRIKITYRLDITLSGSSKKRLRERRFFIHYER